MSGFIENCLDRPGVAVFAGEAAAVGRLYNKVRNTNTSVTLKPLDAGFLQNWLADVIENRKDTNKAEELEDLGSLNNLLTEFIHLRVSEMEKKNSENVLE